MIMNEFARGYRRIRRASVLSGLALLMLGAWIVWDNNSLGWRVAAIKAITGYDGCECEACAPVFLGGETRQDWLVGHPLVGYGDATTVGIIVCAYAGLLMLSAWPLTRAARACDARDPLRT